MKHILQVLTGLALAVALSAVPVLAQEKVAAGPSGGGGGEKVSAPSAPSGGSTSSSGGSSGDRQMSPLNVSHLSGSPLS